MGGRRAEIIAGLPNHSCRSLAGDSHHPQTLPEGRRAEEKELCEDGMTMGGVVCSGVKPQSRTTSWYAALIIVNWWAGAGAGAGAGSGAGAGAVVAVPGVFEAKEDGKQGR